MTMPTNHLRVRGVIAGTLAIAATLVVLFSSTIFADEIGDLERDADSWISKARAFYRLDCADMEKIWEAYCGQLDSEDHEQDNINFAREVARTAQEALKRDFEELFRDYEKSDGLKNRAEGLKNKSETQDKASRILEAINKEYEKLKNLQSGDTALKGSDQPFTQYAIEYGKYMHRQMCKDNDCMVCDQEFSGNRRPDCVVVKDGHCWVYEFKPNNEKAKRRGDEQLRDYVEDARTYYQDYFPNGRKPEIGRVPGSDFGGRAIIQALKDCDNCWDDDKRLKTFEGRVVPYSPCEKKYRCIE